MPGSQRRAAKVDIATSATTVDDTLVHALSETPARVTQDIEYRWDTASFGREVPLVSGALARRSFTVSGFTDAIVFSSGGEHVVEKTLPTLFGGGSITADIEAPEDDPGGLLFALGNRGGGLAVYVSDSTLRVAVTTAAGTLYVRADRTLPPGRHRVGCVLRPAGERLHVGAIVDGTVVGGGRGNHRLPLASPHEPTVLSVGYDCGLHVGNRYRPPFAWNGTLHGLNIDA
ncbi:hypothetical protein [Nocardia lijiangensis]|uniref:hypothetical protein n=1 Tax=Nocardia lijiangensis TaxID=299618 RepID=UPI0012DF003E|nr:hypothetical protein [Nocardia lijiangensis]